jgi:putative copper resistance protein D
MDWHDTMIYVRAVHFAACMLAAGVVFFCIFIAAPALAENDPATGLTAFRARLVATAWISLALAVVSGAIWLLLTAQSMSGEPLPEVLSQGVIWTVLTRTEFGHAWLFRLAVAGCLGAAFAALFPAQRPPACAVAITAAVLAAAFVGGLAWAGHAIGASGLEGTIHPAADVLHLIAAAAWVGTLPFLALLFVAAEHGAMPLPLVQAATLRFSTLGIASVATLFATGIVNSWYLVGSVSALTETPYGKLLLVKVALFFGMVAIAAVNRFRFTPRMAGGKTATTALRQLRNNAVIETLGGAVVLCIVAVLGTLPPASHAHHHAAYGAVPEGAAFVHIHTEAGMADVTITPGHTGEAHATIRLWNGDFESLDAQKVTVTLAPPTAGGKPTPRIAVQDSDGAWQVNGLKLSEPGNWTVTVDAALGPNNHLLLDAPIVIEGER